MLVTCIGFAGAVNAERLPLKAYTTANGLAHNEINKIVRDSRGFLWFCTSEGLSLFDGYGFRNYGTAEGLPHAVVTDILETRGGDYWVATFGGLVRFDPKGRASNASHSLPQSTGPMFTVYAPSAGAHQGPFVTVLLEGRDGTVWAGTRGGLFRVAQGGGRAVLLPVDLKPPTEWVAQEIGDTILNSVGSGGNIFNYNGSGIINSRGYNLSSDAAGGDGSTGPGGLLNGTGDIRNTNPFLGPLQDNGGPTMTHALLSYSPAIDTGDPNFNPNAFNPPLLYDQRGPRFRRVVNGCVDIGAFELQRAW